MINIGVMDMRVFWVSVLLSALAVPAIAQVEVPLVISRKVILHGELEDLAAFGGVKEMTCDTDGNIFTPTNRKYGSAINSILRITPDAKSYTQFSIDSLPKLVDGHITDFALEPSGDVYALARQVLKYSEVIVPIEFGETFIVHYDRKGNMVGRVRLVLDTNGFEPTSLAVLKGGEYLVIGFARDGDYVRVLAQSFRHDGRLKSKLELSPQRTRSSNGKRIGNMRVIHPVAIKANGSIYVMRGATSEPAYVLSEEGQLRKTVRLRSPGLEFDSPHILNNDLIVHEHSAVPEEQPGLTLLPGPERVSFPVFDLETGELVQEYYWHEGGVGLACYAKDGLTFMGNTISFPSEWVIFYAKPAQVDRKTPVAENVH